MSNEIEVTVRGWIGQRPKLLETKGPSPMMSMRVGTTPRRRDKSGAWVDGETTWLSVIAFGELAENVTRSLRKGDPVVVRGRLAMKKSERDGREFVTPEVLADAIGPELTFGTALYAPVVRRARDVEDEPFGPREERLDDEPSDEAFDYVDSDEPVPTA